MCTVTLSYDGNNALAQQQLTALLASGLFMQLGTQDDLDIDYNDAWLHEDHDDLPPLPEAKETYTLEKFRNILINDLNEIYGENPAGRVITWPQMVCGTMPTPSMATR